MRRGPSNAKKDSPNPDKPEILTTKTPRHKEKDFYKKLRVFVSWWRKS